METIEYEYSPEDILAALRTLSHGGDPDEFIPENAKIKIVTESNYTTKLIVYWDE